MRYDDDSLDGQGADGGGVGSCQTQEPLMATYEPARCHASLSWPPDALTSLLMQADSVPELVLDALLRRVAAIRTSA